MNATPNMMKMVSELLITQQNSYAILCAIEKKIEVPPKPPLEPEVIQEVLMRDQVLEILNISKSTYYRHIEKGILIPRKLGKRNYFYHSDLVEALEYSRIHGYI